MKEIPYLHLIRSIACVMVVFLHTLPAEDILLSSLESSFKTAVVLFTRPCVPLFFMISGILLFPVKENLEPFYKKRLIKIGFPLIFWGVIYSIFPYLLGLETIHQAFSQIILIPITYPTEIGGILWFLYVLFGIYLIAPFLSEKIFLRKRYLQVFISLWLLSSFFDLAKLYLPQILGATFVSSYNLLSYFSGYLGYCVLGCYIHNYVCSLNRKLLLICIIFYLTSILTIPMLFHYLKEAYMRSFLSINTILMSICLFLFIKRLNIGGKFYCYIKRISTFSFGIYLIHMLIYRSLTEKLYLLSTSPLMQLCVAILTFFFSYFLIYSISKISFSKYFIGV